MIYRWIVLLALTFILLRPHSATAQDWSQWRGPNLNGSTSEAGLPDRLDPKSNLLWKTDLPGWGSSTPVSWEDQLFVSAVDGQSKKLLAICLDATTGKVRWSREVGEGFASTGRINLAGPSPITDGKTVWFYYGSGDLAAFDMQGKALWARNIQADFGAFNFQWLYCASPLLNDGKMYIPVLHRDTATSTTPKGIGPAGPGESYLLAINPQTGKDIFRHIRNNDAIAESRESYGTPLPSETNGRKEIMVVGGDCITGHDPETGKELWRFGGWNPQRSTIFRVVPSLVTVAGNVIVCTPQTQGKILAIRLGGSGDITATHKAWENVQVKTDVPSALVYQNNLYVLDGDFKKGVSCLDPSNGKVRWTVPIPSRGLLRASPTGADGKIYIINEAAEVWVLSAADGKILSNTTLESQGQSRGTIIAARGRIIVRTGDSVYCFGKGS